MEFQDVVRHRRMVRNYDPDRPVDRSVLTDLLARSRLLIALNETLDELIPAFLTRLHHVSDERNSALWGKRAIR